MTPILKAKLREELGSLTSDAKLDRVYRAVLEGIREPTEEMEDAADDPFWGAIRSANEMATKFGAKVGYASAAFSRPMYRAMVDALLSQGEAVE